LAAFVVAFAEAWLYISQAKRVERAKEQTERFGEGATAEPKIIETVQDDQDEPSHGEHEFADTDTTIDPEIQAAIKAEEIIMEEADGVTQTSREAPKSVRLRRRPVAGQDD
jgi:hypothetical protein